MPLEEAKAVLDDLIRANAPAPPRRWWDAMRDEGE
jgi:hypothetical protein